MSTSFITPKDTEGESVSAQSRFSPIWDLLRAELGKAIVGQNELIEQLVIAALAKGHCFLVGMPGVAKSLAAQALASVLGLDFHRIRCSPDLGPEDITESTAASSASPAGNAASGLLFANVLLVDGIDRLPPKSLNVLHQAIQDGEVVVRGQRRRLPEPFLLLATRQPEDEDTPAAPFEPRDDRFMFEIRVWYPGYGDEYRMAEVTTAPAIGQPQQVLSAAEILFLQRQVREIAARPPSIHYVVRLVRATRIHEGENPDFVYEWVQSGAGPRAARFLVLCAKVRAALYGRSEITTADVQAVAYPVLRHRVILNRNARSNGITVDRVIRRLLEDIPQRVDGDEIPAPSKAKPAKPHP